MFRYKQVLARECASWKLKNKKVSVTENSWFFHYHDGEVAEQERTKQSPKTINEDSSKPHELCKYKRMTRNYRPPVILCSFLSSHFSKQCSTLTDTMIPWFHDWGLIEKCDNKYFKKYIFFILKNYFYIKIWLKSIKN